MTDATGLAAHQALLEQLRDPSAYPHPVDRVELMETHISSVLLAGEFAYKLKKPVNLGFADFSTLALRRRYCDEEIRLNRRSAPELYLDVVSVTSEHGKARIGGAGTAVDYAVRMRRFDQALRLDRVARAGRLAAGQIDGLAAAVAALHEAAPPAATEADFGTPSLIRRWAGDNLIELRALLGDAALRSRLDALSAWTGEEGARCSAVFEARRAGGFVRECHGDMHLGNLVLSEGKPLPFDCIEFNPQLRFIDVTSDVAFTWMDLHRHGLPRLAARFLNAYLEITGDYAGLATLRFYAVYRALVRAKVALIQQAQPHDDAAAHGAPETTAFARYFELAERLAAPPAARLVLTCGVTASGKTTVAQLLLEWLGALRVRSDVERKRRVGLRPDTHRPAAIGAGLYDAAGSRATYARLAEAAEAILGAGFPAIVDASFLRRDDRRSFIALATRLGVKCSLVLCEAPAEVLRGRVAARAALGTDASDATLDVLAHQLAHFDAPAADEGAAVYRIATDFEAAALAQHCEQLAGAIEAA